MPRIYNSSNYTESIERTLSQDPRVKEIIRDSVLPKNPISNSYLKCSENGRYEWSKISLPENHIFVGNSSAQAIGVPVSGDLSLSDGQFSINLASQGLGIASYSKPQITVNDQGLITAISNNSNIVEKIGNNTNKSVPIFDGENTQNIIGSGLVIDENNSLTIPSVEEAVDTDSGALRLLGGLAVKKDIRSDGTVYCLGTQTVSDEREKNNMVPLQAKINYDDYEFFKYTLKEDPLQKIRYGVSAQKIHKIHPELISTDQKGKMTVDYLSLHNLLINDILREISRLKSKLNTVNF